MNTRIGDSVIVVETSFEARLAEQRKFCELAASVCDLGETVERQASPLTNVSEVLQGVNEAAPRPAASPGRRYPLVA